MKIILFLFLFVLTVSAQPLKKVSIQFQWKHQFEFAGFYAAIEQGYYKDAGLEVELKEVSDNTDIISDVLEGRSSFGISYSSIVSEYYNGKPIVMFANIFKHSALVLISQKDIVTPGDLKNTTIMGDRVELSNTGIGMMLHYFDLDKKDYNRVNNSHTVDDFINKKVDAMTAFITNQPFQLNQKHIQYNILSPSNYGSQFYDVNIFTSKKFYEKDPQAVKAFKKATIKGWSYALKNTDKIISLILEKYNSQNKDIKALKYEAEITKSLILPNIYPLGSIDCNVIKNMKESFISLNMISKDSKFKIKDFLIDASCEDSMDSKLTSLESQYLNNKDEIKFCSDPDWMPYEKIENGQLIGMTASYLELLQERLNIPFKLVPTKNWTQSLEYAKSRKCDILSLAMHTPQRQKYMNFTSPHLSIPLVIATANDKIFINNFQDVLDKTFGAVKGYAHVELLKSKYPNLKIIEYENIHDGLKATNRGEIYGFIDNLTVLSYNIQKKYLGSLKITGRISENWEHSIGVRNDDEVLLSILEKTIKTISEKQKQQILNEWTSVQYANVTDYSLVWKILAVTALIILMFLYRFRDINKYNKKLTVLNEKLEKLSVTDSLTQIYNRRFLDDSLKTEFNRAKRYKNEFSFILLDIDDFKDVNDSYGHDMGDEVLIAISLILKNTSRVNDIVGRWGGEEFMVICPNSTKEGAQKAAEKLRIEIANYDFDIKRNITASFGVIEYNQNKDYHWHITSVDNALYDAKNIGKNSVKVYEN